ncbi:MAG: helix-turn-helix domain-containing protein [Ferruginibacter sp.]
MHFDFNFYSAILLIFFIHGLVYAALLFRKSKQQAASTDKWLAIFLLLCTSYISPWMLGFAGWYDTQPYRDVLFYLPLQQLYFIGPVLFFYVQQLLNPSFQFGKKEWLHLIPGIAYLLYNIVIVVTDKLVLHQYYFLADGTDREFDTWYQATGFISMLVYLILSYRYYNLYKRLMVQVISFADSVLFRWIQHFFIAFLAMLAINCFFYIMGLLYKPANMYVSSWWYFFCFSIIYYYIAIFGYANSVIANVPFKLNLLNQHQAFLLPSASPIQSSNASQKIEDSYIEIITDEVYAPTESATNDAWKNKILSAIEQQQLYTDPELSLMQLSKILQSNPSVISKAINQGFQLNFNDFINSYRVKAVQASILAGEHKSQTLLGIAYNCGFNSKATFNRAFKKSTGFSPKDFVAQQ